MFTFKPFLRITVLSLILAFLLIFLGVKYHWGNQLKIKSDTLVELAIPSQQSSNQKSDINSSENNNQFNPEIIKDESNTLLDSMNKEQIEKHCTNLLSKSFKDPLALELATANCIVSNYQETFQSVNQQNKTHEIDLLNKKQAISRSCKQQFNQSPQYSNLEKQLLIGICVSDTLSSAE